MSTAAGRALLVVNRRSRRGREAGAAVAPALSAAGLAVETADCGAAADIAEAIRARAAAIDRVVIGGGDGTLNAAAPALRDTGLPLGIVPLGTANDLARTLGLPADPVAAARVAAGEATRAIDLGLANDVPFFNVASIGLGTDLTHALTADSKRRWGVLGYAIAGFRVLRRLRPFGVEIAHGSSVHRARSLHVAIGNGRHYGGGMTVQEHASIDDGMLDVYSLEFDSAWTLLRLLPALRAGRHGRWTEVRTLAGETIAVRTRHPRAVNTDGEITTHTPASFQILPRAIRVFVPPTDQAA